MRTIRSFDYLAGLSQVKKANRSKNLFEEIESFLCVKIQKQLIYISTAKIKEVLPFSNVVCVGHTSPWFEGLLKIQGEIYGVLDISLLLGQQQAMHKKEFIIALTEMNENISIIAEETLGLQSFKKNQKITEKGLIDIYHTPEKDINVLSIERLLASNDFTNISIF
ncbi:MAG: chemotaxis protein CheW [Gammaproteobacteria bacterium]|nr:chemotaxis protein CheW [Gammaproteobacteria bacterium]